MGHSLWDLPRPLGQPEEPEGQLVWTPSSLSDDSWARCGNLAPRELPTEICLLLARTGTLVGESCALGPCPFLSGQRITFVWQKFTGTLLPDHDLTSRTKDLTPRSLLQLTIPLPHLSCKRALLKAFREFGVKA